MDSDKTENKCKLANKKDIPEKKAIIVKAPCGREIVLFKLDGEIFALENSCPHMGGPLGEGEIENGCITCPWHGWQFDIRTGSCESMPAENASTIPLNIIGEEIYLA